MINVSNEFQQLMSKRTDFKQNAEITFANGEVLTLTEKNFMLSNNMVTDAGESNGIPLGVAVCRNIQIELMNDDDRFSDYDFFGARIRLFLTFQLSETVERIEYGTFTVLTPETYGTTVIITALDDMYKADADYNTTLVYPATLGEILRDACNLADISQGDTTFLNDNFVVQSKPEDITIRQLFGYVAMISGGNARIDTTGRLRIISYNFDGLKSIRNNIDGGSFNPWQSKVDLDGGDFTYNVGDVADGGSFTDSINYHILTMWSDLKVDTDDIVITGIKTEYTNADNEEMTAEYGVSGYVLQVENPLFVGNEQTAIDLIGNVMVGGRFRQFSGDIVANPTIEFMDVVAVIDRKNNVYVSFVTDINFEFFGFTSIKNSAEPALRNSAKTYSEATKTLVTARKLVKNERSARERAVEQLANDLSKSSGLFMTQEEQEDGSIIYYMHDKQTIQESVIIWKLTASALGISTDGGKTYPYGLDVSGTAILNEIYAIGINADFIRGGTLWLGGENNKNGRLLIFDKDNNQVGQIDNSGIAFYSATTQTQFILSPIYGLIQRDAQGNEYNGFIHDVVVRTNKAVSNLPNGVDILQNYVASYTNRYNVSINDKIRIDNEIAGVSMWEEYCRYRYTMLESTAMWQAAGSRNIGDVKGYVDIVLPERFHGKDWLVLLIFDGWNDDLLNYEYKQQNSYASDVPIVYSGNWLDSYYDFYQSWAVPNVVDMSGTYTLTSTSKSYGTYNNSGQSVGSESYLTNKFTSSEYAGAMVPDYGSEVTEDISEMVNNLYQAGKGSLPDPVLEYEVLDAGKTTLRVYCQANIDLVYAKYNIAQMANIRVIVSA